MSGSISYATGHAAEETVANHYRAQGYFVDARRWRSSAGEIDLILQRDAETVFVEVKASRDFARAAERLRPAQLSRIFSAAEIWLGNRHGSTDMPSRVDVALVNRIGDVSILENVMAP